jgi:hypothetical protein
VTDQAAGLRVWAGSADVLALGVIGEPPEASLTHAVARLPVLGGRRWQALPNAPTPAGWMLWVDAVGFGMAEVDVAGLDVADLYRRVKRALTPFDASAVSDPLPLLLWLDDGGGGYGHPTLAPTTARLLDNLGTTLKRFLNVELLRDPGDWQRRLVISGRVSATTGIGRE